MVDEIEDLDHNLCYKIDSCDSSVSESDKELMK